MRKLLKRKIAIMKPNFNFNLFQAYINKGFKSFQIAKKADIERTRFSRILTGRLKARPDEIRRLSTILKTAQKKLFAK